ncbi:MAG TPA: DUF2203 domain-containing protein [Terriglobales bacterium]|nr:DUF2203 domain-containing protein [Terriglobales bacterium]
MSFDRTFTLTEAQAMLPQLEGWLQSAMRAQRQVEELDQQLQTLISHILLAGGVQVDPIHTSRLKSERARGAQRLEEALGEISASGVQLKDLEQGLLDFPCLLNGKLVLLCWKQGEAAIEHWHGTQEGYANRKPLDPSMYRGEPPARVN